MRHTPQPFARVAAALLAAVTVSGASATAAAPATEAAVKAAFLYNFALFIDWPAEAPTGPFTLCVVGEESVADELTGIARTKTINGRPVQTRRLSPVDDPRPCHILFTGPAGDRQGLMLRRARGLPILTVGDTSDFLLQGGMVRFLLEGNQLRFQLNPEAASESRLKISAQLKRVAARPSDR